MSKINLPALKRAIEALFTPHQLATNPALSVHMANGGVVPLGSLAQLPEVSAHLQVCKIDSSYHVVDQLSYQASASYMLLASRKGHIAVFDESRHSFVHIRVPRMLRPLLRRSSPHNSSKWRMMA